MKVISKNLVKKISGGNHEELNPDCKSAIKNFLASTYEIQAISTSTSDLLTTCTTQELANLEDRINILTNIMKKMAT